jgi:ABC-type uncharacterized transport system involved in gliding motility auxiliary subunit
MANPSPVTRRPKIEVYAWLIAGLGLLLLILGVILFMVNRTLAVEWQIGLGLGGVLVLGAVLLSPSVVRTALTGRSVRYGSNAVVVSIAFVGILGLINTIVNKHNQEYDLTDTGVFTLSEQTLRVLYALDKPVQVIGFFQAGDPALRLARDYLERYGQHSDLLSYEFHDPAIEPALAHSLELGSYGALVFVSGAYKYEVTGLDEQSLTSGLIRVTNDAPRAVYFITGHGEHRIDDGGPEGYGTLKQGLERENYLVHNLDLARLTDAIPAEAAVLILAGADRQLLDTETQLVMDWVNRGGKLMLLIDPLEPVPFGQLLQRYDLSLADDIVVEDYNHALVTLGPDGLTPQVIAPLIDDYPYHEITTALNGYRSFYPFARSITFNPVETAGLSITPLLSTSKGSWAETDVYAAKPEYTQGVDYAGPFHLGVAIEDHERKARLVVFGNAGFVTNQNNSLQMANMDVFINAVNWLAEEEELISIRPKRPENRQLFMTPMQVHLTLFTSVVLIPIVVFAAGLGIWWKRR